MKLDPIVPKQPPWQIRQLTKALTAEMDTFVLDGWRWASEYQPPASELYRRTNTLKRSWSRKVYWKGGVLYGEVRSSGKIAPYNRYVRGEEQARRMKARGWKKTSEWLEGEWPKEQKRFERIMRRRGF